MNEKIPILNRRETMEILKAANEALRHALDHARRIEFAADPSQTLVDTIIHSLLSIEAARTPRSSPFSIKGHSANTSARLRFAVQLLKQMPCGSVDQSATQRSLERVITLLVPLTQDEGPYQIIPRKSRRCPPVSKESRRKRPRFDILIGRSTLNNFYTGLDKTIRNGGIFIATHNLYPKGTVVTITATLPGDRCIFGSATVEWVREYNDAFPELPPGMGLILNNLTQRATIEIDQYLSKTEPIFFEAV
jgi:Tfp pilus assembly protein PilZ